MCEENFIDCITELAKCKDWLGIVNKFHNHPDRNKVLWVFPSEDNLQFLKDTLAVLSCNSIVSIGCGSALLEWIIAEATDIPISCIEVDGAWWGCKYSPPTFLPLHFSHPDLSNDRDTKKILANNTASALLFCYFNNGPAFVNYVKHYKGRVLIIIGPGEGRGTHTNPRPFGDLEAPWTLYGSQEVRNSKDYIAVYCRN